MKFSLSTGTLYVYPLRAIFRWAREAGFSGVELVVNPEAVARGGRTVGAMARDQGLEIYSVHPTLLPLPGWRERKGGMEPTIRLAQEAEASVVVMHTPRSETLDEGEGLAFRHRIEAWQTRLAGGGLRLAVENKAVRAEAHRRYALTPLARLRAFADRYNLGLVLDTTHAATSGDDLQRSLAVLDGRLVNVHLSDVGGYGPLQRVPSVGSKLAEHRFPGTGDLALAELLVALDRNRYTGPVTLEITPWDARAWWPPALRRRLAQATQWLAAARNGAGPHR